MFTFLAIVHIIVSIIMILFILLQDPKGGDGALGMLGGGGSKSLFGNTGGNQFLVKVTKWTAIIFAFTSIYLAALSSQNEKSVMDEYTQESKAPPSTPIKSEEAPEESLKEESLKEESLKEEKSSVHKSSPESDKVSKTPSTPVKSEEAPEESHEKR